MSLKLHKQTIRVVSALTSGYNLMDYEYSLLYELICPE